MNIVLSGIKPTGIPTLGNYLGAMKYFVKLQNEMSDHEFLIFVADLHALTTPQDPKELKENIKKLCALYMACGLNETNLILFIQSEVKAHVELGYIMQSMAYMGELERMTQYKDKKQKQVEGVSSALFTYPTLMAADILLYDAKFVPVGKDQMQHLELTRTLGERFNNRFGDTFIIPQGMEQKVGAKIMDLQEPTKKMDKSRGDTKGCISILDDLNVIKKKIKSAVTDTESSVHYDPVNKPGISNLMTIYSVITGLSFEEIKDKYIGKGYGDFKTDLAEIVATEVGMVQEKFKYWYNSSELERILNEGRMKAEYLASKKMAKVKKKLGYGR